MPIEPITLGAGILIGYLVTKKDKNGQTQVTLVPPASGAKLPVAGYKFKTPIMKVGRYTGLDADYQLVVEWKVSAGYIGHLDEISVIGNDATNTVYYINVMGVDAKDKSLLSGLSIRWEGGLDLAPESMVQVYVHSNGAATITVDAIITGREEQVIS